jgi:hypothetical protein
MVQSRAAPIVDTIPNMLADAADAAPFSIKVFIVLMLIVLGSMSMFLILAARWTVHRRKVALEEWADQFGFAMRRGGECPGPLVLGDVHVEICLEGRDATLLQVRTPTTPASRHPERPSRWHLLIKRVAGDWPATALRPAARATSVVDLLSVSSFPSLLPPERFVVFGTGGEAAAALSESHVPALLPHDVGLVLAGSHLILDFSGRAFDELEFNRLRELAQQLAGKLPVVHG